MADNVLLPPTGTGTADVTVKTDDVSGAHYQYVKIADGTLGGTDAAIVLDGALNVVDATAGTPSVGAQILGTNTYSEGTSVGVTAGAVRRDADTTLVNTTNEFGPLQMDANGRLKVEAFSGETLPTSLATLPALVAGSANIGDVDVVTLPALVAGSANIGDVDVLTVPADPFGVNADAASGTGSISAKLRLQAAAALVGDAAATATPTGIMEVGLAKAAAPTDVSADNDAVAAWRLRNGAAATVLTAAGALVGGDATNGLDVDVTRLPALVAGTANIGDVDVLTVPADPFGANADAASATGSVSAKLRFIAATGIPVTSLPNVTLAAGTNTNEVVGDVAQDAAIAGNPVNIGLRASTAIPAAMSADGDAVYAWSNRNGAQVVALVPGVGLNGDPFSLLSKSAQYTTTQTGTALVTPTGGKKLIVTKVQIQVGGTTAGEFQLWFGGSADTTYTRGTDRAIFDGEFAPSATVKPGVVMDGPWIAGAADDILRVTDSAALNKLTVTAWYYEV